MLDFRLTDEQKMFRDLARDFAQNEIAPAALLLDQKATWEERVPNDLLKKGSELGFRTFVLAEENGGTGMSDLLTSCLIAEELGAGDIGTAYYFMLTARRARDWFELRATPEQKEEFLKKFLEDDMYHMTVAAHEPDTDLAYDYLVDTPPTARFRTTAVEQPDGSWIINGAKNYQTIGYTAKLLLVMANTESGPQSFLVEGDSEGLVRHPMSKMGRRVGDNAEIFFDNVRVPAGRILPPGEPRHDTGTVGVIAAMSVGLARAALDETIKFVHERQTGGKLLVKHQATALALADMSTALEAARLLVWKAAWAKDNPDAMEHGYDPRLLELQAAMNVGEAVHTIIIKAMELFGGAGVITGMPIEKYARDSFVQLHVSFPTSNRLRIAESLVGFKRTVSPLMPL